MNMLSRTTFIIYIVVLAYSMPSSAIDLYIGGLVGISDTEVKSDAPLRPLVSGDPAIFEIQAGIAFSDYWALQAGYSRQNTLSDRIEIEAIEAFSESYDLDFDSMMVSVIGSIVVSNNWFIHGEIGVEYWSLDAVFDSDNLFGGPNVPISDGDDGFDLYYGAGLSYRLSQSVEIGLSYRRYDRDLEFANDVNQLFSSHWGYESNNFYASFVYSFN